MRLTSDETSATPSIPVLTSVQTLSLLPQGRPDRPDHFARAYMYPNRFPPLSKILTRYGQHGQSGQPYCGKASGRPDLGMRIGTVRTGVMFHANPRAAGRRGAGSSGQGAERGGSPLDYGSSWALAITGNSDPGVSLVTSHFQGGCGGC